jgi:transcriptional regulator with XRE-family HTH domain
LLSAQLLVYYPTYKFGEIQKVGHGMIFSGNQLRAARALLGLDQEALAEKVGVSDNTIRNMEACGAEAVGGFASTRDKVRTALEELGIEFLNGGEPGVRLRKSRSLTAAPAMSASASKPVPATKLAKSKKTREKR